MALFVAIFGDDVSADATGVAAWGSWGTVRHEDATTLALHPNVSASYTSKVLVLAPAASAASAQTAASTIAAIQPRLAVHVSVTPVSLAALLRAVETVPSSWTNATAAYAALHMQLKAMVNGAWMPSVANLESPAPGVGLHAQSLVSRGSGFIAAHNGGGWVEKLPLKSLKSERRLPKPSAASNFNNASPGYECHAFGQLPNPARSVLAQMGLTDAPIQRDPLGDAQQIWGHQRAVEFVITPTTPIDIGRPSGRCPSCTEPVWGPVCPFCRVSAYRSSQPGRQPQRLSDQGVS